MQGIQSYLNHLKPPFDLKGGFIVLNMFLTNTYMCTIITITIK